MIARIVAALERFEDSWAGHTFGTLCLFGILIALLYAPLLIGGPE
jgi:hypothetical protein